MSSYISLIVPTKEQYRQEVMALADALTRNPVTIIGYSSPEPGTMNLEQMQCCCTELNLAMPHLHAEPVENLANPGTYGLHYRAKLNEEETAVLFHILRKYPLWR
jgi:hypothetical protein